MQQRRQQQLSVMAISHITPFAQFTITVKTVDTANKLKVDFSSYNDDDYDDEEVSKFNYSDKTNTLTITNHFFKSFDIYTTPYNYTGEVTAISSNPEVVSIVDIHNLCAVDGYYNYDKDDPTEKLSLITLTPGTSTITLKANGAETSFNVVVKEINYNTYGYMYLDIPLETPIHIDPANGDDEYYDKLYDDFSVKSSNTSIVNYARVSRIHDISGNIYACKLEVETRYESGPVTLTVLYKGKEVGSVTINVISTDNDEYGDNDDYDYYEDYDYWYYNRVKTF